MRAAQLLLVTLLSFPSRAPAEATDAEERSRLHYEIASGFYNLGNYTEAAREFAAGYQLTKKPEFLIDLGQCYRKLNDRARAAEMFKKYLAEAPPSELERRRAAEQVLGEIERELAAPGPVAAPPAPVLTAPAPAPRAVDRGATPPPRKSGFRRLWWILPVVAVVVAGAALTAYFLTRPSVDCGGASFGCVTFPGGP